MTDGFRRKRKQIHLTFEGDPELEGLEVTLSSMPLGEYLEVTGLDGQGNELGLGGTLECFARHLVSWNLQEEDGTPVPATYDAVMAEDTDQMLTVSSAWLDVMRGLQEGDPLPESSPDGGLSLEESIPMETRSESLAS